MTKGRTRVLLVMTLMFSSCVFPVPVIVPLPESDIEEIVSVGVLSTDP